ncbi:putative N-acetyltransferase HLS1 [Raphanus sativus]|uniref:Probable N-acetyltransferase HLS1 n=1 Tax=Raphanus sativus TaxID=3726 RepID=A0A6J0N2Y0_RAPSA|nr:probable N-acetyltransferase HLS1 [Raphanus sativus]KAJ4898775.1 putative N-acetyltransferase HLS1 [Raphanus sativus]
MIVVREYDWSRDLAGVEDVERRCEVGPSGKLSLFTDLLGDPLCRIRHSPSFIMLVAEMGTEKKEIVGMIRGCIKTVTCGIKLDSNHKPQNDTVKPLYTKLAYVLGLRVSPSHRRQGIGLKLVKMMEEWFRQNGAEYSYIATENDNQASVNLFTGKCGYSEFRKPSILVNPVYAHRVNLSRRVTVIKLDPVDAESLYRLRFSTNEFFPRDIDSVLNNELSLGTFVAVPRGSCYGSGSGAWPGSAKFLEYPPESWAVLSVWNCKDSFRLEVRGASRLKRVVAKTTRVVDKTLPFLKLPSIPSVFKPFGLHFMYGIGGEGPQAAKMVKSLCGHAHNLAKDGGCSVLATEVAGEEPLRRGIPHWKVLSCDEDLWCIKRLGEDYSDGAVGDWTNSPPGASIFVDPREF